MKTTEHGDRVTSHVRVTKNHPSTDLGSVWESTDAGITFTQPRTMCQ